MEENTLTVLLIEDSPQFAQLVQHWLANIPGDSAFVLNWTDSLADGMSRLDRGGVDVILLDLGLPDCSGMETFIQARDRARDRVSTSIGHPMARVGLEARLGSCCRRWRSRGLVRRC